MSATKNGRRGRRAAPLVTAAEALELLASAVSYCLSAGLSVRAGNVGDGLSLMIGGAQLEQAGDTARFVLAPSLSADNPQPATSPAG